MRRICVLCKEEKPLDREHFNFRSIKDGKFGNVCKPCQKQYRVGHYQRNKADYIEKAIKANSERRIRNRKLLWDYLSTHPCVDCGIANPLVLEFDHVRGNKAGEISRMITQNA
jgi:hypothetical protein